MVSLLVTFWTYGVVAAIWTGPSFSLEAGEFAVTRSTKSNPYYRLLVLFGYILVGVGFISFFFSMVWPKLGVLASGFLIGGIYYWKPEMFSSPSGSTPLTMSLIPALGVMWILIPVTFVWMLSYLLGLNVSDFTGAGIGYFLVQGSWLLIATLIAFLALVISQLVRVCERLIQTLADVRPAWYSSRAMRYSMLLVYLLLNSIGVFAGLLCLDLIYFGFADSSILPGILYNPFSVMYGSYDVLELIFAGWPVLSARAYAIMLYILFISPMLFFFGMWVCNVAGHVVSRVRLFSELHNSKRITSDVVPGSVLVVTSDQGGFPNAHAGSLFFGRQDFILVSESLLSSLDGDELDAVLAHEVFHLENQDWVANLLASLFSVLFGGRSSLLVFYNYPRIEREADDYAVERVGTEPLYSALERLELEALKFKKGSDSVEDRADQLVSLSELRERLTAPYRLFFSPMLLDLAHLSHEERRERIENQSLE